MPPSRRRPTPSPSQAPPVRRPRVAGRRNRPANPDEPTSAEPETTEPAEPPERETVSGTLDLDDTPPRRRPAEPEPADEDADTDTVEDAEPAWTEPVADVDLGAEPDAEQDTDEPEPPRAAPRAQRPAGKRRATGTTRPADLETAEAQAGAEPARVPARRALTPRPKANLLAVAVVLAVVAVVLAGLAVWFRGEASNLESGDPNSALTDSAMTSQAVGQIRSVVEETFSFNYTDLASTERAADESLTGKARCEYDKLFAQVKELSPEQKLILMTAVRDIALVRLDGDRAEALVFIDQSYTRVDQNKTSPAAAQFGVLARRDGESWKITEFNMFDQTLANGQPAPQC